MSGTGPHPGGGARCKGEHPDRPVRWSSQVAAGVDPLEVISAPTWRGAGIGRGTAMGISRRLDELTDLACTSRGEVAGPGCGGGARGARRGAATGRAAAT